MKRDLGTALVILTAMFLLTGCGPSFGDVSGVVKYQGQPVAGGTITFYGENHGAASSEIKADGSYAVKNVEAGTAKIAVVTPMAIQLHGFPASNIMPIPDKYFDREKSGLTCNVAAGAQKKNFDLD